MCINKKSRCGISNFNTIPDMLEFLDDGLGKISLKTQTFIHGNKHIYFAFQVMKNSNLVETPFSVLIHCLYTHVTM